MAEKTIILFVSVLGLVFIWYTYNSVQTQNHKNAMRIAQSVVASLPVEKLEKLHAEPGDSILPAYQELKASFMDVIKANSNARFAYLYAKHGDKYYFYLDSEPASSPDCSPAGQEFTEAADIIKQPFFDEKNIITPPTSDRWGTWVSVLIPIKNKATGNIIAVFGMDINAKSWQKMILVQVLESSILVIVLVLLVIFTMGFKAKNRHLVEEIDIRLDTAKALSDSEERYRLLYENATIGIYRTTPNGQVLLSNKALVNMLGYKSFDELKEKDIENGEFDPNYSRSEFKQIMERDGEIYGLENVWTRQDGKLVYIRENAKAVRDNQGKVIFYDGTVEDITDRKLAEKALQYSEERFRQIAEQSREVVWEVDETGLYTYVSPLSTSVLGYEPSELIGKKYLFDLHQEESRDDFRHVALHVFEDKLNFHDYIHQVVKGTGESIWVITNGVPILDEKNKVKGYRGADSDITERIQRENQLKKLMLAVEQSPVSIVITSLDGSIEYGNPKACETTGYSLNELAGQNPRILKSGDNNPHVYKELWESISSGKIWSGEFLNRRKNGELYWEAATISPIFDNEGNIINYLAVKEDITNIKKLISELQKAKDKAESSDMLKLAFIKSITHEIRTPLHGIVGMSEHFLNTSISQQTREQLLHFIKESSTRLINTVNSYLDISLLVSGNYQVNTKPFDLNLLLYSLKNETQHTCLNKNLTLHLRIPLEYENLIVNTDEDILQKILLHLMDNATKFTEVGNVAFGYTIKDEALELFVKDTGIGIDRNFLPNIFEVFTQADVSDTRAYEGSGLGLAIVYRLVQLISGQIRVESEKDRGASFYITLPLNEVVN